MKEDGSLTTEKGMKLSAKNTLMTWHKKHAESRTFGAKLADDIATLMGSWRFIIAQSVLVGSWVILNVLALWFRWDPYPFILLNLLFSTQAAYAAPIIMMSQNRQSERDREHADMDFRTNVEAKREIELMIKQLQKLDSEKLDLLIAMLADTPAGKRGMEKFKQAKKS